MQQHDNLIAGQWTKGHASAPNLNPSNLGDTIAQYAQGDASHVDAAVAAATAAVPASSARALATSARAACSRSGRVPSCSSASTGIPATGAAGRRRWYSRRTPSIVRKPPLIVPLGAAFGVHPVHLGIIFIANLELGFLTPPVGLNLFLASYRFKRPVLEVRRGAADDGDPRPRRADHHLRAVADHENPVDARTIVSGPAIGHD